MVHTKVEPMGDSKGDEWVALKADSRAAKMGKRRVEKLVALMAAQTAVERVEQRAYWWDYQLVESMVGSLGGQRAVLKADWLVATWAGPLADQMVAWKAGQRAVHWVVSTADCLETLLVVQRAGQLDERWAAGWAGNSVLIGVVLSADE